MIIKDLGFVLPLLILAFVLALVVDHILYKLDSQLSTPDKPMKGSSNNDQL